MEGPNIAIDDPVTVYDIARFISVILLLGIVILANITSRKFKIPFIIYIQLALTLIALSSIFSVLRFWFYPWEFALLEYVFFALGGFVLFIINLNFRKMGLIDHDGIPVGDEIG